MVSQSKTVTSTDGASIYAAAFGQQGKPSIVLIHGVGLCADVFQSLVSDARLLDQFYMVTYDMRGHGRSTKPTEADRYASKLFAADFAAVCEAFGLKKPFLLGWSLGAAVATDVSSHLGSDYLSGVVYLAPLPYIGPIMKKIGMPTIGELRPGLVCVDNVDLSRDTTVKFTESLFTNPDRVPQELKYQWMGMAVTQPASVTAKVLSRPQDPSKLLEAGKAGLPVLLIGGSSDKQISLDAVAKELDPHFTKMTTKVVEGGGHALFIEYKDACVSEILSFARSNK